MREAPQFCGACLCRGSIGMLRATMKTAARSGSIGTLRATMKTAARATLIAYAARESPVLGARCGCVSLCSSTQRYRASARARVRAPASGRGWAFSVCRGLQLELQVGVAPLRARTAPRRAWRLAEWRGNRGLQAVSWQPAWVAGLGDGSS